jgi:hypothetical protein
MLLFGTVLNGQTRKLLAQQARQAQQELTLQSLALLAPKAILAPLAPLAQLALIQLLLGLLGQLALLALQGRELLQLAALRQFLLLAHCQVLLMQILFTLWCKHENRL